MSPARPLLRAAAAWVALAAAVLAGPGAAHADASAPGDPAYLGELVAAAKARHLADAREWHVLLHYRHRAFGGFESEVDGADFFNAPDGKRNPEGELAATLAAFFAPLPDDENLQHPQCRFIARYTWLNAELGFDPARLKPQVCDRFRRWAGAIRPDTVVLVFPSAYVNSPPSMFGHTLYRLDRADRPELLDYALNYAAQVPENPGPFYALKGLVGLYPGKFTIVPYYAKVQTYAEFENRDLWEYDLNLTPDEIDRLLMHAWELGPTYFDYFFVKENCSYHLLSLLEAARPDLDLTGRFHVWTVPTDTLRAVAAVPGLVTRIRYRPSRGTIIRTEQAALTGPQVALARGLAEGRIDPSGDELAALAPETRARVLDLGQNYLLHREAAAGAPDSSLAARRNAVLLARSRVDVVGEEPDVPVPATPPDRGHGTQRFSLGGGARHGSAFVQAAYRAAYHDLLDPTPGYDSDAQVEVVAVEARAYTDEGRLALHRVAALDILSLAPWDGFFRPLSWRVTADWRARRTGECDPCGAFGLRGGTGLAAALGPDAANVAYAFVDLDAAYGPGYSHGYAVGPAAEAGLLMHLGPAGAVRAAVGYTRYALGDAMGERRFLLAQRVPVGHGGAVGLRFEGSDSPLVEAVEGRLEAYVYW
jgi:hypothetical protein